MADQGVFEGRTGRRSKEQMRLEMMRRGSAQTDKYTIGGKVKQGGHKPRPITLAPIKMGQTDE